MIGAAPTLRAAAEMSEAVGIAADSVHRLRTEHGWRRDGDGSWRQLARGEVEVTPDGSKRAWTGPREPYAAPAASVLVADEAGMLAVPEAAALARLAADQGWRLRLVGDPRQLAQVGSGGVMDAAVSWAGDDQTITMDGVVRHVRPVTRDDGATEWVVDASYSALLDRLLAVAATNDEVRAVHDAERALTLGTDRPTVAGMEGQPIGVGDTVASRRNDRQLGVRNRDMWTVRELHDDGSITVVGHDKHDQTRRLPAEYVGEHVQGAGGYRSRLAGPHRRRRTRPALRADRPARPPRRHVQGPQIQPPGRGRPGPPPGRRADRRPRPRRRRRRPHRRPPAGQLRDVAARSRPPGTPSTPSWSALPGARTARRAAVADALARRHHPAADVEGVGPDRADHEDARRHPRPAGRSAQGKGAG